MRNHAIVTVENPVHHVEKDGSIVVSDGGGDSEITINHMYHVPKVKKNLFSVANDVDYGNYLLFWPKGVNFLRNLKKVEADVIHSGKQVKNLFVLSASNSYVEKMSSNDNALVWHARLGRLDMNKFKVMV